MKKILITAMALAAFLFAAQSAQATLVTGSIMVNVWGHGMLTSDAIDCGSGRTTCAVTATWDDNGEAPEISLVPTSTKTGWEITSWSGCSRLVSMRDCRVTFQAGSTKTASAAFFDVQAPNVFLASYTPVVSDRLHVTANVTDNEKVTKVEYLLDDEVVYTQLQNFGNAVLDTSEIPEGERVLKVRAIDGNYNVGESNSHIVEVDHTPVEIVLLDPATHTNEENPSFSFDMPNDDAWGAECEIRTQGEAVATDSCWDDEPFVAPALDEGSYEFVVSAHDQAGNEGAVTHEFVVDRTAPVLEFTSGPDDDAEVSSGEVSYGWTVTDGLKATQKCTWDGGEAFDCDGAATRNLPAGPHTFTVTATDLAGNATSSTRTVTVKSEPAKPGKPEEAGDVTAPVVRIVAPKQTLRSMRRALRLNVRCGETCSGRVVVRGPRGIRFSGRVHLARAGVAKLRLRPTAKVRKRLRVNAPRSVRPRAVKLTATARLADAAGNTGKSTLRFRVKA